jgi:hypothetical protein
VVSHAHYVVSHAHYLLSAQVLAGITMALYILQLIFPDTENYLAIIATNTYGEHTQNIEMIRYIHKNNQAMTCPEPTVWKTRQ